MIRTLLLPLMPKNNYLKRVNGNNKVRIIAINSEELEECMNYAKNYSETVLELEAVTDPEDQQLLD